MLSFSDEYHVGLVEMFFIRVTLKLSVLNSCSPIPLLSSVSQVESNSYQQKISENLLSQYFHQP